jgi:hypothetical protein
MATSVSLARAAARKLVDELGIGDPAELDVELVAAHCGAFVTYRPLRSCEGHLLRSGGSALIVVDAEARRHVGKWRFVIAHELGHFLRHPQLDQLKLCTRAQLSSWYRTSGYELEANHFAAELLMPTRLVAPLCDRNRPSLHDVEELTRRFRVSLSSAAIRFVTFSPEPCAVVMTTAGTIRWSMATSDFGLRLERGYRVGRDTYAGDLFAGRSIEDEPQPLEAVGWTDDDRAVGVELFEHSRHLPRYNSVLSFLWRAG